MTVHWLLVLALAGSPTTCPTTASAGTAEPVTSEQAVALAEAAMVLQFGAGHVGQFRPYTAAFSADTWIVTGTLPPGARGGTPTASICAENGQLLTVSHNQ